MILIQGRTISRHYLIFGGSCALTVELSRLLDNCGHTYDLYSREPTRSLASKGAQSVFTFDPLKAVNPTLSKDNVTYGVFYISAARDATVGSWEDVFQINIMTYRNLRKLLLPGMIKAGGGRFISFSSAGTRYGCNPSKENYAMSKLLLTYFTGTDKAVARQNILTNNIEIGVLDSNVGTHASRIELIPTGRTVPVAEVARMSLYLNSDQNSCITCTTVSMTGGE